ncbi:NACHT domain-containing NTPase [Providencia alcalifaciens]
MELTRIINRLDQHVHQFFSSKNINSARKAGEAICKIIIADRTNTLDESKKFDQLISLLTPKTLNLSKLFLSKIQSELRVLQSYGNSDSHDNEEELNTSDLIRIQRAIMGLLSYLFDSKDEYNLDHKIPNYIYELINEKNIGNDNWRCQQIISTIYPNRKIIRNTIEKDYEFHVVEDADGRKIAFLGLNRNISFKEIFDKSLQSENLNGIDSLTFLFPLEISKTTGMVVKNRKEYIQRTSQLYIKNSDILCSYNYYDDYIWDKCLPSHIKVSHNLDLRDDFIDQNLFDDKNTYMSLDFVDSIISETRINKKPLNIIFGQGGVGKTTFCEQSVQKINREINGGTKRKAIYISSIDIPDEIINSIAEISSIEDLYSIIFNNDEDTRIEKDCLALNISCGNLIIIIDGLDEIISKLKDKFNVDGFFESIKKLNDTYRSCTVIVTSREITLDSIDKETTNVLYLKGFDDILIDKYLRKRFKRNENLIQSAYDSIKKISSSDEITPLIIRLLSDLTEDAPSSQYKYIDCSFLDKEQPLDKVVLLLIAREIQKQSLDMNGDQYFLLLQSIIFEHQGKIKEEDFIYQIQYILQVTQENKVYTFTKEFFNSYLVSSLLERINGEVSIKYESIEFLIKLRYLTYIINSKENYNDSTIDKTLAYDCYRGGVLVDEISKYKNSDTEFEKNRIDELIKKESNDIHHKKIISALLYIFFSTKKDDRSINAENIKYLFNGERVKNISIFGDFHPIDFTNLTVENGFFDNYSALGKSLLPKNKTVFNKSKFINFNEKDFGRNVIYPENFNSDCDLSDALKKVIDITIESDKRKQSLIEDDLIKIFKVGFKNGTFMWKSVEVYKQQCASLKTRFSLLHILNIIENSGLLIKEVSKSTSSFGYKANSIYVQDIKDFVTQRIISTTFNKLIISIESQ